MFPDDNKILNETSLTVDGEQNSFNGKAFLYDFKKGDFVYKNGAPVLVEGREALKVWIEKCLRTVRFKAIVHKDLEYGPQIEDLIGSVFDSDFVNAEIERECTEALLRNPYIVSVDSFTFEMEGDKMTANITITDVYETGVLEVSI